MTHFRGLVLLACLVSGCASRAMSSPEPRQGELNGVNNASTTPAFSASGNDGLSLDEIRPAPVLPKRAASTQPDGLAPVEAVRLFAQARIAMLDGNRGTAIDLLEKATELDPDSFQLHSLLGQLYFEANDARAREQWEKAAAVEPDHLDLQITLGRQLLARSDFAGAIVRLRLARQTTEYGADDPAAAEADFLLARALQEGGYDRAALECYEGLLSRLQNQPLALRHNPEAAALLAHPEALALHIAALYEKHRDYRRALAVLRSAAARNPHDFEVQAQIVRDLAASGQKVQALDAATDLVQKFHASSSALEVLRQQAGSAAAMTQRLQSLHKQNPEDRDIVYALVDSLGGQNRDQEAGALLAGALGQWPDDPRLLRRQFEALHKRGNLADAAKVLIEAVARHPENHLELAGLWDRLSRPSAHGRLRAMQVEALAVSPGAAAAKLFLESRSAQLDRGEAAERDVLKKAVEVRPIFAPAWRQMMVLVFSNDALSAQKKAASAAELADAAGRAGDATLADALRAQALLNQEQPEQAAVGYAKAVRDGDRSPDLYLHFATALHLIHDEAGAVSLLTRLIDERPLCEEAYLALFEIYQSQEQPAQAGRVLGAWLASDPDSPVARRLQAREAIAQHRNADARGILLELLERHDSDPEVLAAAADFFTQTSGQAELGSILEKRLASEPWNFYLGQALALNYQEQQKSAEALRVAGGLEAGIAADPDLLYLLSGLMSRLGSDDRSEAVLAKILKIDPGYAGANNDLGYLWIEHGKKLVQAEELIRKAVASEPDNTSFLDSLGWVLYKRGKFDEALRNLTRAAEPIDQADPVVLDHLGDTLYRLGNRNRAAENWQQASKRLAATREEGRDDSKELRDALNQKQQDLSAGRPVSVAPVLAGEGGGHP